MVSHPANLPMVKSPHPPRRSLQSVSHPCSNFRPLIATSHTCHAVGENLVVFGGMQPPTQEETSATVPFILLLFCSLPLLTSLRHMLEIFSLFKWNTQASSTSLAPAVSKPSVWPDLYLPQCVPLTLPANIPTRGEVEVECQSWC